MFTKQYDKCMKQITVNRKLIRQNTDLIEGILKNTKSLGNTVDNILKADHLKESSNNTLIQNLTMMYAKMHNEIIELQHELLKIKEEIKK